MGKGRRLIATVEKFVRCLKCDKGHVTIPEPREHKAKDGTTVFGVATEDYTYYIDNFKDLGYGPICNEHNRDDISIVPEKRLYID